MKSIFKGKKIEKKYYFSKFVLSNNGVIMYYYNVIERPVYYETDLKTHYLQKGEKFYIAEKDEILTIEDVIRTSDDCIIYFTDKIIEIMENIKSKEEAEKIKKEYEENI